MLVPYRYAQCVSQHVFLFRRGGCSADECVLVEMG